MSSGPESNEHVDLLIGELQQRTEDLEQANRELRRVSHYRSLFLARMSHELRTPLTAILGFTEILLEQEQMTDAQRGFCQRIQDSGMQLQTSLDQLVDLSRIEAGQTELFLQEFPLRETMRDACAGVARLAQKHQVKIEYELAPDLTTIVSDEGRLRQILYSFLAWSVNRSSSGQTVSLSAEVNDAARLLLRIEDQGMHIESAARVFDPKDQRGSGDLPNLEELGVIIGKRLLDMMGGTIALDNQMPSGLRTIIDLPAGPVRG